MGDKLDQLFQEWHRLGGAVLLAHPNELACFRSAEEVIAESTLYCRASGRLMWVVVDWLIRHIELLDEKRLMQETTRQGDLSVLGVICDVAYLRQAHPKFEWLTAHCRPQTKVELFFYRVARSKLATKLTEEHSLPVFRKWNYLCQEVRYL